MVVESTLKELCERYRVRAAIANYPATPPIIGLDYANPIGLGEDAGRFDQAVLDYVREQHVQAVLLVAKWDAYVDARGEGRWHGGVSREAFTDRLLATVAAIRQAGATPWIMQDVPTYDVDVPRAATATLAMGDPRGFGKAFAAFKRDTAFGDEAFGKAQLRGAVVVDPSPALCWDDWCHTTEGEKLLYVDTNHLSRLGAAKLLPFLRPLVESVTPGEQHGG